VTREAQHVDPRVASASVTEVKASQPADPASITALRCLLDKRPAEALVWLDRYDKPSQELLLLLLPLVARVTEGGLQRPDPHEAANILVQLNRISDALRRVAELRIETLVFCEYIRKFGVYEKREDDKPFGPGEHVELYFELRNFSNERLNSGYGIRLATRVEIQKYDGQMGYRFELRDRPDVSLNSRHDFFKRCSFDLPGDITPGNHILRLIVTDLPTGRVVTRSLDFRVGTARSEYDRVP
jgi:hypothetical protein